jgi:hypothetical protein
MHQHRFRFVLNQIDRVDSSDREELLDDFVESLEEDGVSDPLVIATAADPPVGEPVGIDLLVTSLRALGEAKDVVRDRIVVEVAGAADRLAGDIGVEGGGGTGFGPVWQEILQRASAHISADLIGRRARATVGKSGRGVGRRAVALVRPGRPPTRLEIPVPGEGGPGRRDAVELLEGHIDDLAPTLDGAVRDAVRAVEVRIEDEIADAAEVAAVQSEVVPEEPPHWWGGARAVRWTGVVAGIVAGALLVDTIRSNASLLPAVVGLVAAVALVVIPVALAGDSGQRWAESGFEAMRSDIEAAVAREIDRRVGRPLRDALRMRAGAATAYTELKLLLGSEGGYSS